MFLNFDIQLFRTVNNLAGEAGFWDEVMVFSAEYSLYVFGAFLVILFFKNRRAVWSALLSGAISRGIFTVLIRYILPRERPFVALENVRQLAEKEYNEPSFPSGHAAFLFAIAFAVYLYDKKFGIVLTAFAVLFTFARIYTGIHYPLDILGGAAVALLSVWIVRKYVVRER